MAERERERGWEIIGERERGKRCAFREKEREVVRTRVAQGREEHVEKRKGFAPETGL